MKHCTVLFNWLSIDIVATTADNWEKHIKLLRVAAQRPRFLRSKVDFVHLSHANHRVYSWASRLLASVCLWKECLHIADKWHLHCLGENTPTVASLSLDSCGNSSSTVWSLHVLWQVAQMLARTTCHRRQSWIQMPLYEQFVIVSLVGCLRNCLGHLFHRQYFLPYTIL